jgi:hypothetical protein
VFDRDLFDLPRSPDHPVVADEVIEEGHEAELVVPDLRVPDHEAPEEVPDYAVHLDRDGILLVHEEDEDIPVGGIEGRGPLRVLRLVARRRHVPSAVLVGVHDRADDLVIVDAAVVGTDEAAQLVAGRPGGDRLAHELHVLPVGQVPQAQVDRMGGDRGTRGHGCDLPNPSGRRPGDRGELAEAPVGRVQGPEVLVYEIELATGIAASSGKEALVRECRDPALISAGEDRLVEVVQGEVALVVGPLPPLTGSAGDHTALCYGHENLLSGSWAGQKGRRAVAPGLGFLGTGC